MCLTILLVKLNTAMCIILHIIFSGIGDLVEAHMLVQEVVINIVRQLKLLVEEVDTLKFSIATMHFHLGVLLIGAMSDIQV